MNRKTTLLATLFTGLLVASAVQAEPPSWAHGGEAGIEILQPGDGNTVSTETDIPFVLKVALDTRGVVGTTYYCTGELYGMDEAAYVLGIKWVYPDTLRYTSSDRTCGDLTCLNIKYPGNWSGIVYPPTAFFSWENFTLRGNLHLAPVGKVYPVTMTWSCDFPDLAGEEATVNFYAD